MRATRSLRREARVVEFKALGTISIRGADGVELDTLLAQPKRFALLAYLSLATPRGFHRRDTLLALFWPESDEAHARAALRKALHILRRAVGEELIVSRGDDEVAVDFDRMSCDVVAFDDHVSRGRVSEALALYRGDLLPGFFVNDVPGFEQWLERERSRLRGVASRAADRLTSQLESDGRLGDAVAAARTAASIAPTDERVFRRLLELLSRVGDRTGAITAYEDFVRRAAESADVEPSIETRNLVADIRAGRGPSVNPSPSDDLERRSVAASESVCLEQTGGPMAVNLRAAGRVRTRWRVISIGIGTILVAAVAGYAAILGRHASRSPVIAVLPMENMSARASDAYFAETMHAELISRLGMIPGITVTSRGSVLRFRGDTIPTRSIGRSLGADFLLKGRTGRDSQHVHVWVSLIDARTNTELWVHSYSPDRSVSELFEIQADIARRIADALQVKVDATVRGRIGERPTENALAYDLFLRATQLPIEWEREANTAAEELLKQALRLDSSFPSALAGLARVYQLRAYTLGGAREWADSGLALARMAVEADTALPAGYAALGFGHLELGHLERSRGAYRKVLELRPSDGEALLVLGWIEFLQGRLDEAVTIWTDALAVDPMNATVLGDMALVEMLFGDFERARRWHQARSALPLRGGVGGDGPARLLLLQNRPHEALADAERRLVERPRSVLARDMAAAAALATRDLERARQHLEELHRAAPDDWNFWGTTHRTLYAWVLLQLGEQERGRALLKSTLTHAMQLIEGGDQRPGVRREIAAIHAATGDSTAAFEWLEKAIEAGWRHESLKPSPLFEPLRGNRRFTLLMERMRNDITRRRERVRRENLGPQLPAAQSTNQLR
jgi:DNA-binding SARP family transcriptional activator/TolB-like protein/tetratricopeptide (TPR) repeat protein